MNVLRTSARVFVAASVIAAGLAGAQEIELRNWTAPPYWMPPAAESPAVPVQRTRETPARTALGRTALVTSTPLPFVGITPCRQYDSRNSTVLLQNTPRTVTLTGAPCGIPATAQAVALNITIFNIAGAASNGVFSVGISAPPPTAWINYPSTETQRGNAGVVGLTVAGEIIVQVNQTAGSVDFVVDVFGYYAPGAAGAGLGLTGGPNDGGLVTQWVPPSGYTFAPGGENDNSVIMPATCPVDFRVRVDVATGASTADITYTLRVNGADTAVSCTLLTTATSCVSGTAAPVTAGDLVTLHVTGAANYGAAAHYWVALKCQ